MIATKTIDEKYKIQKEIKRGGFGIIYQGVDLAFGKKVAIKAVEPAFLGEAKYIDMFRDEALSVARLNHHNIVEIYDIRRGSDDQFYIIMEYIDGPDLSGLIRACRKAGIPFPLHLGVYIVTEVCSGLDYAHNRRDPKTQEPLNIVHQDISPSNIMVSREGEVKIIDFGIANFRRQQPDKKNEVAIHGKLNYLAPEQLNGVKSLDRRVDIFSLGLVLYELITGERLLKSENPQQIFDMLSSGKWNFSRLSQLEISPKLQEILRRALAVQPQKRYATANEMYMDLMHFLIMTAPAADFPKELSDFVQKRKPEIKNLKSENSKTASPSKNKQQRISELLDISEDTVVEIERKQKGKNIDLLDEKEDTSDSLSSISSSDAGTEATPEADVRLGPDLPIERSRESTAKTEAKTSRQKSKQKKHSSRKDQDSELDVLEAKKEKAKEVEPSPHKKKDGVKPEPKPGKAESLSSNKKNEPVVKVLEPEATQESEPAANFYSIVEETEEEEDELKTIIDVVRLSARTHQKSLMISLVSVIIAAVLFTVVDTFAHFTSWGTSIYDYLFPPAIKIVSIPSGAQVYLDDKPIQETTPVSIDKISPGVHKLMLTMSRFEPIVKSINVPRKGELQVVGEKKRSPSQPYIFRFKSQLELSSRPAGASIFINNLELANKTPVTIFWEVSDKPIQIKMAYAGLPDLTGFEINGVEGTESIADRRFWKFQKLDRVKDHFAIEGVFRKPIKIRSIPNRAEIYLDDGDRPVGITGLNGTLLLTLGQHLITLRKNGYLARKFSIDVNEKTQAGVTQVLLRRVRIFAKEEGSLDDSDIGAMIIEIRSRRQKMNVGETTPAEFRLLPYRYTVALRKPGFQDTLIQISPRERTVVARMKRVPARVALLVIDARNRQPVHSAQVFYKNLYNQAPEMTMGITDTTGNILAEIPAGRYQVRVAKRGYLSRSKILNLRGNALNRYTFQLDLQK